MRIANPTLKQRWTAADRMAETQRRLEVFEKVMNPAKPSKRPKPPVLGGWPGNGRSKTV